MTGLDSLEADGTPAAPQVDLLEIAQEML